MFTLRIQERGKDGKLEMHEDTFKTQGEAARKAIEIYKTNKNLYTAEIFEEGSKYPIEAFDGLAITDRSHPALPPWAKAPDKPDHTR